MLAVSLVIIQVLLLGYFLFFSFFNFLYSFASFFYKRPKGVKPSGKKIAVVIVSFNEKEVILDTLNACKDLNYKNKTIIIADDSKDGETYPMLVNWMKQHGGKKMRKSEVNRLYGDADLWYTPNKEVVVFHRHDNFGFKGGCMRRVDDYIQNQGIEYMYLLDADWRPDPNVLGEALGVLESDENFAFVQTKREHYNRLTGIFQHCASLSEEAEYEVELPGRHVLGHPILFTGCCTLFRIKAIKDAGDFPENHLTEDIDLTNRLYLRGWKAAYVPISNYGEVAPSYKSLVKQQERWAQGTARSLKDFFRQVINSVHLNPLERLSLTRQNMYYSTAIAIEISVASAIFAISWMAFFPESYQANLYMLYMSRIAIPFTILLFFALFSNFVPLFISVAKSRHYHEFFYIFFSTWLFWSLLHTYFWANIKGFLGIKSNWFKTPKTSGKSIKDKTHYSRRRLVLNVMTLLLFLVIYTLEWHVYGWVSPYAYFWVPAMTVGIFVT